MTLALILSVWWHIPFMTPPPPSPFEPSFIAYPPDPPATIEIAPPIYCGPLGCLT